LGTQNGIKSVDLALDILELVCNEKQEVGITAIARELGVTKTTIFRHMQTLSQRGYLIKNPANSKYVLGPSAAKLQPRKVNALDLLSAGLDQVRNLASQAGQTVVLSSVSDEDVTVLHTELGRAPLEIGVRVGSRLPLHASAQGKVAMAFHTPLLNQCDFENLVPYTESTIVNQQRLLNELELIRNQGWGHAPEEMALGINSLAAPIMDSKNNCIGIVAIVGSIQFIGRKVNESLCQSVIASGQVISKALSNQGHK